jgi:acetolactate synthase I/II/III large subunit
MRHAFPSRHRGVLLTAVTVVDVVARALHSEGVEYLMAYPTTPLIDAAARAGVRPVLCRQERVGVGMADGYSRVCAHRGYGVFACQFGPGIENSFSGIASAYGDRVPILILALGNPMDRRQLRPQFQAADALRPISKHFESVLRPDDVAAVMRRAFSALKHSPTGPVIVELPADVATMPVRDSDAPHVPIVRTRSSGDPQAVDDVVDRIRAARAPFIVAGHGVLLADATASLIELAELYQMPVVTTLSGKSSFPERHPLSVGTASVVATDPVVATVDGADLAVVVGSSLSRHFLSLEIPAGVEVIHITDDARDFHKTDHAAATLLGDARLILEQLVARTRADGAPPPRESVARDLDAAKAESLRSWQHKLAADERPITPYRVIRDFMLSFDPDEVIVTHDSGSPRDQLSPWYVCGGPNSYLGWGKSHALGGGLGLTIGAKLAAPEKLAVHFHGDAAFGMTGVDLETAVRIGAPIMSILLNNSTMAIETHSLVDSHRAFGTRDIGGDYVAIATALGVDARRVEDPAELPDAFRWAATANRAGRSALLEIVTSAETDFINRQAVNSRVLTASAPDRSSA